MRVALRPDQEDRFRIPADLRPQKGKVQLHYHVYPGHSGQWQVVIGRLANGIPGNTKQQEEDNVTYLIH
jgi:hypothetical protein